MVQLPLLPARRIRSPFQRDCEPHGQYGIDTAKEVSLLVTRTKGVTYNGYTLHCVGCERSTANFYRLSRCYTHVSEIS